jgi:hypothetical protein
MAFQINMLAMQVRPVFTHVEFFVLLAPDSCVESKTVRKQRKQRKILFPGIGGLVAKLGSSQCSLGVKYSQSLPTDGQIIIQEAPRHSA